MSCISYEFSDRNTGHFGEIKKYDFKRANACLLFSSLSLSLSLSLLFLIFIIFATFSSLFSGHCSITIFARQFFCSHHWFCHCLSTLSPSPPCHRGPYYLANIITLLARPCRPGRHHMPLAWSNRIGLLLHTMPLPLVPTSTIFIL